MFTARQQLGKQVPAVTNKQAAIVVFLSYKDGSTPSLYNEDPRLAGELRESLETAVEMIGKR
jgi:hypothetical protein